MKIDIQHEDQFVKTNFLQSVKENKKKQKNIDFWYNKSCGCKKESKYCSNFELIWAIMKRMQQKNHIKKKISSQKIVQKVLIQSHQFNHKLVFHNFSNFQQTQQHSQEINKIIFLDIQRSFRQSKFFQQNQIQILLQNLLLILSLKISQQGYVQGMNFWCGALVYHCQRKELVHQQIKFLFQFLELDKVYDFDKLDIHIGLFCHLLKNHIPLLKNFIVFIQEEIKIYVMDWYLCLMCDKIPLDLSHIFFVKLFQYGWYFFYRVIITIFKKFSEKHKNILLNQKNFVDLKINLKIFFKNRTDWEQILKDAQGVSLNDEQIDIMLDWQNSKMFKIPEIIINQREFFILKNKIIKNDNQTNFYFYLFQQHTK